MLEIKSKKDEQKFFKGEVLRTNKKKKEKEEAESSCIDQTFLCESPTERSTYTGKCSLAGVENRRNDNTHHAI